MRRICSLVALVLLLGALTASANIFGRGKLEFVVYDKVHPRKVLSPVDLMVKLGRPLRPAQIVGRQLEPAELAVEHLADARDKDAKLFLGTYSANELLALNEIYRNDLNAKELERRRGICKKFELGPEESEKLKQMDREAEFNRKRRENMWSLEEREIFMKDNLFFYCRTTLGHFEYRFKSFLHRKIHDKLSKKDLANLEKLADIGKASDMNQPALEASKPELNQTYDEKEMRDTCKKLIKMIRGLPIELKERSYFARKATSCSLIPKSSDNNH